MSVIEEHTSDLLHMFGLSQIQSGGVIRDWGPMDMLPIGRFLPLVGQMFRATWVGVRKP